MDRHILNIELFYGTIRLMRSKQYSLKNKIIRLRKSGKTYGEIKKILKADISKSTLSFWCKNIILSKTQQSRIKDLNRNNLRKGRMVLSANNKIRRKKYLESVKNRVQHLEKTIKDKNVAKIALAMLYLGEGKKSPKGSLMFGNSNPKIIDLFLRLLRYCHNVDESKFRCTVQCRADQNTKELEKFWQKITDISRGQFYKTRIDPRTIGRPSKKPDYKGVCRIDYFSADIFHEIMAIGNLIFEAGL